MSTIYGNQTPEIKKVYIQEFNKKISESGIIKHEASDCAKSNSIGGKNSNCISISIFLNWILEQINDSEFDEESKTEKYFNKVVLIIENSDDVLRVYELACGLKLIFDKESSDLCLKEKILKTETVSSEAPNWPNRWFLYVLLKGKNVLPCISYIWYLPQVEQLELNGCILGDNSNDKLNFIPHDIGYLKHLKVLILQHNHLKNLPFTLIMCQKLEELLLEFNKFNCLPEFLLKLPSLKTLYRLHNSFIFNEFNFITEAKKIGGNKKITKVFECESLYLMSLKSFVMQVSHLDLNGDFVKYFPAYIRDDILQLIVGTCSNCSKIILHDEGFIFTYACQSFVNCNYVPVSVYTCSRACAEICLNEKMEHSLDQDVFVFNIHQRRFLSNFFPKLRSLKKFICC